MEEKSSLNLFIIVISIITLLLVVASTILAWYSNKISSNEKILITNRNLTVEYVAGNAINLKNISPGTTTNYIFKVSSAANATGISNYEIEFNITSNNFKTGNLVYQLKEESDLGITSNTPPIDDMDFQNFTADTLKTITSSVKPSETKTYTLSIYYTAVATTKKNLLKAGFEVKLVKE